MKEFVRKGDVSKEVFMLTKINIKMVLRNGLSYLKMRVSLGKDLNTFMN